MESKTENYVFITFGNGISHTWEQKSTTGRFATGRFWLCTWKISSVSKDQVNNWELCILKITPPHLFLYCFNGFFGLEPQHRCTFWFYSGIVDSFIFIYYVNSLVSKGLLLLACRNEISPLVLNLCPCVQLLCLLCSLVSYWVKYSKRMSISTCACTLFLM